MTVSGTVAEHVAALRLIDNHGYWLQSPDRRGVENALNEANTLADFDSMSLNRVGGLVGG